MLTQIKKYYLKWKISREELLLKIRLHIFLISLRKISEVRK